MPPTCGLWLRRQLLVAVVLDEHQLRGRPPLLVARSDDGRLELLEHLAQHYGRDCALIATEGLLRIEPIGELALRNGLVVWCAPQLLIEAIRSVTGLAAGPPRRSALMLARLPLHPFFRPQLRHHSPPSDRRQLPLL
jgi:hypothetical protein